MKMKMPLFKTCGKKLKFLKDILQLSMLSQRLILTLKCKLRRTLCRETSRPCRLTASRICTRAFQRPIVWSFRMMVFRFGICWGISWERPISGGRQLFRMDGGEDWPMGSVWDHSTVDSPCVPRRFANTPPRSGIPCSGISFPKITGISERISTTRRCWSSCRQHGSSSGFHQNAMHSASRSTTLADMSRFRWRLSHHSASTANRPEIWCWRIWCSCKGLVGWIKNQHLVFAC